MDKRDRILGKIKIGGLLMVLVAACAWALPKDEIRIYAHWVMAVGALMLAVGRLMQTPFYEKYEPTDPKELTMRRLYRQSVFGLVGLVLAVVFMFLPVGFYAGMWLGPTSWLIPFVFFVVVEVYTVFRISALEKG